MTTPMPALTCPDCRHGEHAPNVCLQPDYERFTYDGRHVYVCGCTAYKSMKLNRDRAAMARHRPVTTTPSPSNLKRSGGNPFWLIGLGLGFAQDVVRGVREFRRTQ